MIKNKFVKLAAKILIGLTGLSVLLFFILFEKIDRTPYQQMTYYKNTLQEIQAFNPYHHSSPEPQGDTVKVGWAKENITPVYHMPLAGYGFRNNFVAVKDSIFVRTFVFDNGKTKVAYVTLDLLIFPPKVAEKVNAKLSGTKLNISQTFFSATHTHNSCGGWLNGLAGYAMAGGYDERYVRFISEKIIKSIEEADLKKEKAMIGYGQYNAADFVGNRLAFPDSRTDTLLRVIKIKKISGPSAAIITFSAHANCMDMHNDSLSRDYPGVLIDDLESSKKVDFAMFSAGMVGSHSPAINNTDKTFFAYREGTALAAILKNNIDSIPLQSEVLLFSASIPLHLREPHLKISDKLRIRPWVFKFLFGKYNPDIKIFRLGNIVMIGMPCDFSGELMTDFEEASKAKNINLVITSFNGGYIGYINVDKYYDSNREETKYMNWFGPYNQAYFTEIVNSILKKI